jgi:fatty-acyl-CoA synthase
MIASVASRPLLLGDLFRQNAELLGSARAASLGEVDLSHRELDTQANRVANSLRAAGVRHGDRVATFADTHLGLLSLFVACARLGALFAPVNARLGEAEAQAVVALCQPKVLVADAKRAETAARIAATLAIGGLANLDAAGMGTDLAAVAREGDASPFNEPALQETDPHVLFFTSGSTGRPKGVVLSHRASWLRSFQGVFRDEPEHGVCMFPLFHMAGFSLALSAWQTRGSIAFVESPTPEALLGAVERNRATRLYAIPLVWSRILASDTSRFDCSSLRELDTGTQAVPIELVLALKQRFPGTRTRIYYGSTEAGSVTTLPDADVLRRPGSVGPPAPGVEIRLGEDHQVEVRSPSLMSEYFDDPEATRAGFRDGWFRTGDLGVIDADGALSIVGRANEVIRSGGESVAPAEVEAVLAAVSGVREVAVVGLPDPDWGEIVCAAVVLEAGFDLDLEALQAACEGTLAGYKKPRRLEIIEALPRTAATRQVQRTLLVEQILAATPA